MTKKFATLVLALIMAMMMVIPALAQEGTPSPEAQPAPEVVVQEGEDGQVYHGIFRDDAGKQVAGIPAADIVVTPLSAAATAPEKIKNNLERANQQLQSVNTLAELSSGLEAAVKDYDSSMTVEDLFVGDLFDVSVLGDYADYFAAGNTLTVRFKLNYDPQLLVAVLQNVEGTWKTIPATQITRNDDNTVDVTFSSLGTFAFLYDGRKLPVEQGAPTSPLTSDVNQNALPWFLLGGVTLAAAIIVLIKKH